MLLSVVEKQRRNTRRDRTRRSQNIMTDHSNIFLRSFDRHWTACLSISASHIYVQHASRYGTEEPLDAITFKIFHFPGFLLQDQSSETNSEPSKSANAARTHSTAIIDRRSSSLSNRSNTSSSAVRESTSNSARGSSGRKSWRTAKGRESNVWDDSRAASDRQSGEIGLIGSSRSSSSDGLGSASDRCDHRSSHGSGSRRGRSRVVVVVLGITAQVEKWFAEKVVRVNKGEGHIIGSSLVVVESKPPEIDVAGLETAGYCLPVLPSF